MKCENFSFKNSCFSKKIYKNYNIKIIVGVITAAMHKQNKESQCFLKYLCVFYTYLSLYTWFKSVAEILYSSYTGVNDNDVTTHKYALI